VQFAGPLSSVLPVRIEAGLADHDSQRIYYNPKGVSALVDSVTSDGMTVNEQIMKPFVHGVFATLIPADATAWQAGFKMWRGPDEQPYNGGYFKISFNGSDHLRLIAFSESQEKAVKIMRAGREVLRDYPATAVQSHDSGFKVFIAFGGGRAWEVVRDYLKRAGVAVDAFTEAERAGEITLDVVSEMIGSASMSVVVMTAADEMKDGTKRARQNVIHEAGYSQGALGTRNTIVLLEKGVDAPSNIAGLTYIPFEPGEIHTTEERVVRLVTERMSGI
jgi:predicted nucleotide-binding protein